MLAHRTRAKTAAIAAVIATDHRPARGDRLPGSSGCAHGQTAPGSPEPHGPPDSGRRPGPAGQGELGRHPPKERRPATRSTGTTGGALPSRSGATTYSDRAIVPGAAYSYTVTAGNAAGSSHASAPADGLRSRRPRRRPATSPDPCAETPSRIRRNAPTVTLTWAASTVPEVGSMRDRLPDDLGYTISPDQRRRGHGGTRDRPDSRRRRRSRTAPPPSGPNTPTGSYAHSAIGASPASEIQVERILATRAPTHGAHRLHRRHLRRQHLAVVDRAKRGSGHRPILSTPVPRARTPTRGPTYPSP